MVLTGPCPEKAWPEAHPGSVSDQLGYLGKFLSLSEPPVSPDVKSR